MPLLEEIASRPARLRKRAGLYEENIGAVQVTNPDRVPGLRSKIQTLRNAAELLEKFARARTLFSKEYRPPINTVEELRIAVSGSIRAHDREIELSRDVLPALELIPRTRIGTPFSDAEKSDLKRTIKRTKKELEEAAEKKARLLTLDAITEKELRKALSVKP